MERRTPAFGFSLGSEDLTSFCRRIASSNASEERRRRCALPVAPCLLGRCSGEITDRRGQASAGARTMKRIYKILGFVLLSVTVWLRMLAIPASQDGPWSALERIPYNVKLLVSLRCDATPSGVLSRRC